MAIDPYRTLELAPGATTAEIKRAYRRLAKANHPDSAGVAATPRFLAIQAAYEMLLGEKLARSAGRPQSSRRPPWQADSDRARATREAWRARTGRPSGASTDGPEGERDGSGRTGAGRAAPGQAAPGEAPSGEAPPGDPRSAGSPRGRARSRKASLGSTSYDDALGQPLDPDWTGASWYGRSSGTYWTLNPKEYADPRKHGPEYQARARRASGIEASESPDEADEADERPSPGAPEPPSATATGRPSTGSPERPSADEPLGAAQPQTEGEPTNGSPGTSGRAEPPRAATGESAPGDASPRPRAARFARPGISEATFAGRPRPSPRATYEARAASAPWTGQATEAPTFDLERLIAGAFSSVLSPTPRPRSRLVRALLGWLPLAWALATLTGGLTGCERLAASCTDQAAAFSLVAVAAPLPLLLAAPTAAGIAASGAVALLLLALPLGVVVVLFLGSFDPAGSDVLAVLLTAAFVSGVGGGLRFRRGLPTGPGPGTTLWPIVAPAAIVLVLAAGLAIAGVPASGIRLAASSTALVVYAGAVAVAFSPYGRPRDDRRLP